MSWEAADSRRAIVQQPSVSEVFLRCRAVKAAAAAGDFKNVIDKGSSSVQLAVRVMGNDCDVVRQMRSWVRHSHDYKTNSWLQLLIYCRWMKRCQLQLVMVLGDSAASRSTIICSFTT
jgi:hypothetical protein